MKTLRNNDLQTIDTESIELYDNRLDTLARVEIHNTGVVIRTTRDDITTGAKAAFVHYLATEGFIPERYRRYSFQSDSAAPGLRWLTDSSWVSLNQQGRLLGARLWAFLTWGRLLALGLFLTAFILALWLKPH